jgi:hypothetical protein
MTTTKITTILENNKFFPHLYDPYYDRRDVKAGLIKVLNQERRGYFESQGGLAQDKMMNLVGDNKNI